MDTEFKKIISEENFDVVINKLLEYILQFGKNVVMAIVVYFIGRWIFNRLSNIAIAIMLKRDVDLSLRTFLTSLINIVTTLLLIVIVVGILGVDTASFIAVFASAGVAIGMALSGTLQNFAGGVMILLFKPFKVGDVIEAQGYTGAVKEIQIFNTLLTTPDNQVIIIPNGGLSTGTMKNISKEAIRRVDWSVGIAYGDDYDHAKSVLQKMLANDSRVLKDPAAFIALSQLGDSAVVLTVRAWVNTGDYWSVYFDMNERIYKEFAKEGLNIPYPQMDVHVKQD